jgi:hypothetical protein
MVGPVGTLLLAIVERARSGASLDSVEVRANEAFSQATLRTRVGSAASVVLLIAALSVAGLGTIDALRQVLASTGGMPKAAVLEALAPLEALVLLGAPALAVVIVGYGSASRLRHELERWLVRAVDGVADAGETVT